MLEAEEIIGLDAADVEYAASVCGLLRPRFRIPRG